MTLSHDVSRTNIVLILLLLLLLLLLILLPEEWVEHGNDQYGWAVGGQGCEANNVTEVDRNEVEKLRLHFTRRLHTREIQQL